MPSVIFFIIDWNLFLGGCFKFKNAYRSVIQTTEGRKNLDGIKDVSEILRFALDDRMVWNFYYDIPSYLSGVNSIRIL